MKTTLSLKVAAAKSGLAELLVQALKEKGLSHSEINGKVQKVTEKVGMENLTISKILAELIPK